MNDHLIVALEDARLMQMDIDMNGTDISVQGRRRYFKPHKGEPSSCIILPPCDPLAILQVKFTKLFLNSVLQVKEIEGEFLALKLVSGPYAYSMEAVCPKRESYADNDTSLWPMQSKWEYLLNYSVKLRIT